MPVSKKRKKKRANPTPPPPKGGHRPKPKITKQRILLYIISAVMIISLAASFLVSGTGSHTGAVPQTETAVDGPNLLTDPVSSEGTESESVSDQQEGEAAPETQSEDEATSEGEPEN